MASILSRENSRQSYTFWKRLLVRLAWCAVIGTQLFLLLDDITLFRSPKSELPETTGERVAEIRESLNGVHWQSPKDIVWNDGYTGQTLYEGQSLMTLSDSEARLVFDAPAGDETTDLWIGPKTLVQLSPAEKIEGKSTSLLLSLSRGKIRTKTSRPILLSSGEFQIQVDPGTSFQATLNDAGTKAIEFEVTEGRVHSGDQLVIEKGQRLSLPLEKISSESLKKKALPLNPEIQADAPKPIVAPLLPPPNLKAPILRTHPKESRLKPRTARGWFKIFLGILVQSAHADEFELEIELGWEPVPGAATYQVQIAKTRTFSKLLIDETAKDASYTWLYKKGMENSKSRVFYRVASIDATGKKGEYSKPVAVVIPIPTATAVSPIKVQEKKYEAPLPPERKNRISASALYASYSQSSDTSLLRGAKTNAPFIHEALEFATISSTYGFTARIAGHSLEGSPSALAKTRRLVGALNAEKNTGSYFLGSTSPLFIGISAELGQRLEKMDANSLKLSSGLSIGPSLSFSPASTWRISLALPLSGLLFSGFLSGPAGLRLASDYEIFLASYAELTRLCLSLKAAGSQYYWKSPEGTIVTEWSIGAGPTLYF